MELTQAEALEYLRELFANQLPFHQLMGIELHSQGEGALELRLPMRPALVGNPAQQILHGGVTATLLDVAGGLTAFSAVIKSRQSWPRELLARRMKNLGTIDLRVDYLRPGRGELFVATGTVIRAGNKVAVARMELHNERGSHIAFGTGTYLVG
ncbi:thioesterase family protein [Ferrimonas sediminicola]|uniref:Medium/long-chain acyl-CoA thioesterase YigI n=1 Tax=Ferrimonas sediminicola TaxID=2569538 RepID=A0A4U1BI43_9GAMM|nr:thioesterase family protein [Ferrimonas sediminicola]TKB51090.1 thioesterase family protein [Ferrimonas sediminicola]